MTEVAAARFEPDLVTLEQNYAFDFTGMRHFAEGGYASIYQVGGYVLRIAEDNPEVADMEDAIRAAAGPDNRLAVDDAILTRDGRRHMVVNDAVWRIAPFAEGRVLDAAELTDTHLRQAATQLALFHASMEGLSRRPNLPSPDYESLPIVYLPAVQTARNRVTDMLDHLIDATPQLTKLGDYARFVTGHRGFIDEQFDRLQRNTEPYLPQLPTTIVHGDYWVNNLLFRPDSSVSQIVDFGMSGRAPRIDDLAGSLLENEAQQPDLEKAAVFLTAYQEATQTKLSAEEVRLIREEFRRFSLQEIFYELYACTTQGSLDLGSVQRRIQTLRALDDLDWRWLSDKVSFNT